MISTFDTDKNFWLEHPDMKVINPFKELYNSDKSKKKEDSSLMMWFIVLCYDRDSKYCRLDIDGDDGKHAIVGEDFCGSKIYYSKNKIILDACISMYINLQYTPMEKQMVKIEKALNKRAAFLDDVEYDLDNFAKVDKMVSDTYKVWQDYKKVLDEMDKENGDSTAKGGAIPSLID